MKKTLSAVVSVMLILALSTGCANKGFDKEAAITVITRESGSGTRSAFVELFGIEVKEDGKKVDKTIATALTNDKTNIVMTTVSQDINAIGYISLGSLNDSVKALKINGAEATVSNVKNGSYKISRPFNIATKDSLSDLGKDFISYIMSSDGQKIIEDAGYISTSDNAAYSGSGSGTLSISGSSSVTPVMEKIKEAYTKLNPDAKIEINMSDSSSGMKAAAGDISDIGMASREVSESEIAGGLIPTTIALDGIAVIVNNDNPASELSADDVNGIYTGKITAWSGLKGAKWSE